MEKFQDPFRLLSQLNHKYTKRWRSSRSFVVETGKKSNKSSPCGL